MDIWFGAAKPSLPQDFEAAAERIGCDLPAILAVWEVEAAGKEFNADGSLPRRFEPHKVPGSRMTWRDSLGMSERDRWDMFDMVYRARPGDALMATSWGAPQIMGSNARAIGYDSAEAMVKAFADSGSEQVRGFVSFLFANKLDGHLRAHDWYKFAVGYNGPGQPEVYARKMEAAYRRHSGGKKSPIILRFGATGAEVKTLQRALRLRDDGVFGRETEAAVKEFQLRSGLTVDGVVGFKTWERITTYVSEAAGSAAPAVAPSQPATADTAIEMVTRASAAVTAAAGAAAGAKGLFSDHVWDFMGYALIAGAAVFALAYVVKRMRR